MDKSTINKAAKTVLKAQNEIKKVFKAVVSKTSAKNVKDGVGIAKKVIKQIPKRR